MTHQNLQTDFPLVIAPLVDPETGVVTDAWHQFLWILWQRTGQSQGNNMFSSGMILPWPASDAAIPSGWLLCDGSAISRIAYPLLFDVLGTTWGPGDGSTTFNLPDGRGRSFFGADGTLNVGDTGGASTHTLTSAELAAHSHSVTDPGHTHAGPDSRNFVMDGAGTEYVNTAGNKGLAASPTTTNTASATTGLTVGSTGNSDPFSIMPPYFVGNWIIKE